MAVRARVELVGSYTHSSNWRRFVKNQPQILTNPAEIQYYQNQVGFNVVLLKSEIKEKIVEINHVKPKKEKEVLDEIEYDDDDYEEDDDEVEEGYTESSLRELKKSQLKAIAGDMGLDTEGTRKELVARIVESTN